MKRQSIAVVLAVLLSCVLSGCGGGGESTDTQTASATESATQIDPVEQKTQKPATDPKRAQEIQNLIRKLRSSDERVAYDAILRLGMIGDETAADPLFDIARRGKSDRMRQAALKGLANLGDPRAFEMVLDGLRDRDVNVRRNAAANLGHFKNERAIEPLIDALRDDDDWVRMNATGSLKKITRQDHITYDAWMDWYRSRQPSR
jgi:HEAT repeat protein